MQTARTPHLLEDALRFIEAHEDHVHATIARAFADAPYAIDVRLEMLLAALDRTESIARIYVTPTTEEVLTLNRAIGEMVRANKKGDRLVVLQECDAFIEVCRQVVERLEK